MPSGPLHDQANVLASIPIPPWLMPIVSIIGSIVIVAAAWGAFSTQLTDTRASVTRIEAAQIVMQNDIKQLLKDCKK